MNKCPVCEEDAISQCRCLRSDSTCKNGHEWHYCVKHGRPVMGHSDHSLPINVCTCEGKEIDRAGNIDCKICGWYHAPGPCEHPPLKNNKHLLHCNADPYQPIGGKSCSCVSYLLKMREDYLKLMEKYDKILNYGIIWENGVPYLKIPMHKDPNGDRVTLFDKEGNLRKVEG